MADEAESTIAINPTNPRNLFASETKTGLARFSIDGGLTWTTSNLGAFNAPEIAPGPGGDFGSIAIGPSGQVLVDYQNNASGNGPDTIKTNLDPDGLGPVGFNPVLVATTTNVGGFSPIPPQPARTIDAEGNLSWDRSGGPHNGRAYLV